jgi:hypothetical protein
MAEIWQLDYTPTPKQQVLHGAKVTQILYGGAAGGGKSHASRMDLILACLQNPGCQAYLFRRTYPEIEDNHCRPIRTMGLPAEVASYSETRKQLEFTNGSILRLCFAENEADIHKYQGAEMHIAAPDEAALMTRYQLTYIRSRLRLGNWKPAQEGYFPRFLCSSNPGGPGHNFLKETFIDPAPPLSVFSDKKTASKMNPKGWSTVFIPAKMADNPFLDEGMYSGSFTSMTPERARALRDGDWNAIAGAALSNLSPEKHMLRPFTPPRHWTHMMAMDWGTAKPFSVGWYAISEGAVLKNGHGNGEDVWLPPGAMIRFREWYGWNGESDQGCRMESNRVALGILKREQEWGLPPIDYRVIDSQCWASMDGPSVVSRMREATESRMTFRQGRRDRKANYTEVMFRLGGEVFDMDGGEKPLPMLYATQNCEHFWRTLPTLILDATDPEKGPATRDQEDHVYDEVCFAASSNPRVTTQDDRKEQEYSDLVEKYRARTGGDPYAIKRRA